MKKDKIWVDLDNSPHVPFFAPIIMELNKRGYKIIITARDCFQVCGLAELYKLSYKNIGRHYGKNAFMKVIGTIIRSIQLMPVGLKEKPGIAVSHGSRSLLIAASILKIPVIVILDYEYTKGVKIITPDWAIAPEVIPDRLIKINMKRILKYPGIKEDVYINNLRPDENILDKLGIKKESIVITIRPPATEAHYHNPKSEKLFSAVVEFLGQNNSNLQMVILPRNEKKQTEMIRNMWPNWCANGKIIIPKFVVDGLNLIWNSDLVVSGGGTMNREAAALNVPVYSIFKGKIGAVDQYLAKTGRLVIIERNEDVREVIKVIKRDKKEYYRYDNKKALEGIVSGIDMIYKNSCVKAR